MTQHHPAQSLRELETSRPALTYRGPAAARDSRYLMSELGRLVPAAGAVLDLGCGPRDQAVPIEHLGHSYVGLDYANPAADILGDAHAIPFVDGSFDCVFSYAVIEHLHDPFLAIREVARVLKPGGFFIGTVAQGESFHESYFHLTPWGLIALAASSGALHLERMWSGMDTLQSLSRTGWEPRVVKAIVAAASALNRRLPFLAPRTMALPEKERELIRLFQAGSLCFVMRKEGAA